MDAVNPILPKVTVESPTSEPAIREMPTPMPLPAGPGIFFTNLAMVPPTEMIPTVDPVPDSLAATWNLVKDGVKDDNVDGAIDVLGASEDISGTVRILILVIR
jgi:hypothetical protein